MFQYKLDDYFFPEISVKANPKYIPGSSSAEPSARISMQSSFGEDEEDSIRVVLTVKAESDGEGEVPYNVKIVGVGDFTLRFLEKDKGNSEEEKKALRKKVEERIHYNGMSILYGALRDLIMTLTSRGPWEPVLLPMHFFNKKANQAEDKAPDDPP
ncbi:MAG: hypothetical protein R2940_05035 [Syntrophotaleaceae bacterium]